VTAAAGGLTRTSGFGDIDVLIRPGIVAVIVVYREEEK
jgi:hypothetical protein